MDLFNGLSESIRNVSVDDLPMCVYNILQDTIQHQPDVVKDAIDDYLTNGGNDYILHATMSANVIITPTIIKTLPSNVDEIDKLLDNNIDKILYVYGPNKVYAVIRLLMSVIATKTKLLLNPTQYGAV